MNLVYLLSAVFTVALAKPEGYYQQQYQYRASSSSYKNNELQQKTDDEGYYAKHGDLAGRVEPKVNAYVHHADYVNPNLPSTNTADYNGRYTGALTEQELSQRAEGNFAQFGGASQTGLSSSSQHGSSSYASGSSHGTSGTYGTGLGYGQQVHPSDDIYGGTSGRRNQYAYSGLYSVSNAGLNQGTDSGTQSNLAHLTQQLQDDISRQLQTAVSRQRQSSSSQSQYASSGSSSSAIYDSELRTLEQELRANLTKQLQEELRKQYGTQGKRGSYSYTITSGAYNPTPNYNNQELVDLTAQVEDNLLKKLREDFRAQHDQTSTSYSASNRQYHDTSYGNRGQAVGYKPFSGYDTSSSSSYGGQTYSTSTGERAPVVNPTVRLVDVVQPVQNELDLQLNDALNDLEHRYLITEVYSYDRPDYDIILQNLKNDLRRNLTEALERALYKSYGAEEQRGSYVFSNRRISAGEQVANYKYDDLENLKKQVESNLIQKLTQTITDQKSRYTTRIQQSSTSYETRENRYTGSRPGAPQTGDGRVYTSYAEYHPSRKTSDSQTRYQTDSGYNSGGHTSSGFRPSIYDQQSNNTQTQTNQQTQFQYGYNPTSDYRPSGSRPSPDSAYHQPSSQTSGGTSYQYPIGTRQSATEYTTGNVRSDSNQQLQSIQQELQNDLAQQVQNVISQQSTQASYSSSSSSLSSSASNQVISDLSEAIKRNLTQKLEELLQQHYGRQGIRGGYSYSITAGGNLNSKANYNSQQLAQLTAQLQEQLLQQLREGLSKQTYQYSASYKPIVAHGTYSSGSYGSRYASGSRQVGSTSSFGTSGYGQTSLGTDSLLGEDCMQGDDNFTKQEDDGLRTTSPEDNQPRRGDIPQKLGDSDEFTQQTIDDTQTLVDLNQHAEEVEQKTHANENFNSQTADSTEEGQQQEVTVGLEVHPENEDLYLQTHVQPNHLYGQRVEDLSQQTEDDFGRVLEQQSSAIDAQQTEDGFGKLSHTDDQSTIGTLQLTRQENLYGLPQQTEDLTQQTEDFGQQTQDLTQQQEDLTQQQEDLTQQQEDLAQQQEGFIQQSHGIIQSADHEIQASSLNSGRPSHHPTGEYHTIGLDRGAENGDLAWHTGGSQDLAQPTNFEQEAEGDIVQTNYRSPYARRNTQYGVPGYYQNGNGQITQQSESLDQQTDRLSQQHVEDLSQQTEDLSQQHVADLSQQTEDLSQQHVADLSQQTEDLSQQHVADLSQETERLSQQHVADLSQQTEDLSQQHVADLYQQSEDITQQHAEDLSRHTDNLSQQTVDFGHQQNEGLTQQQLELIRQSQAESEHLGASHYGVNYHSSQSSSHSSSSNSSSQESQSYYSSSHPRVDYAVPQHVPLETAGDLEQEQVQLQKAHVVQDVSPQAQTPINFYSSSSGSSSDSRSSSSSSSSHSSYSSNGYGSSAPSVIPLDHQATGIQTVAKIEQIENPTTTEKPGFWKRLGSKISDTYKSAKESISDKLG